MQRRQEWLVDYLLDSGHGHFAYVGKYTPDATYLTIVEDIRNTLKLNAEWAKNFKTLEDTLNHITENTFNNLVAQRPYYMQASFLLDNNFLFRRTG